METAIDPKAKGKAAAAPKKAAPAKAAAKGGKGAAADPTPVVMEDDPYLPVYPVAVPADVTGELADVVQQVRG